MKACSRSRSARKLVETVSLDARQNGVAPNQLFAWRRLVAQGSLTVAGSGEEVVPASDYRALYGFDAIIFAAGT